jgi:glutamine amidotransferase-like uncharacterized protein
MRLQHVYIGEGINIIHAEIMRDWLSKIKHTEFTTKETFVGDIWRSSIICIPDGDVDKIIKEITPYIEQLSYFVRHGGTLVTTCGGSHALAKTQFYEYVRVIDKFVTNEKYTINEKYTQNGTNINIFNPQYDPNSSCHMLDKIKTPYIACCESCSNNPHLCKVYHRYLSDDNVQVLAVYQETQNPAIMIRHIGKGVLLSMTVLPCDPTNDELNFVLDKLCIYKKKSILSSSKL